MDFKFILGSYPSFNFIKLHKCDLAIFKKVKVAKEEVSLVASFRKDDISTKKILRQSRLFYRNGQNKISV